MNNNKKIICITLVSLCVIGHTDLSAMRRVTRAQALQIQRAEEEAVQERKNRAGKRQARRVSFSDPLIIKPAPVRLMDRLGKLFFADREQVEREEALREREEFEEACEEHNDWKELQSLEQQIEEEQAQIAALKKIEEEQNKITMFTAQTKKSVTRGQAPVADTDVKSGVRLGDAPERTRYQRARAFVAGLWNSLPTMPRFGCTRRRAFVTSSAISAFLATQQSDPTAMGVFVTSAVGCAGGALKS